MLNLRNIFAKKTKVTENFFSLSHADKKRMIKASAIKSNELQAKLVQKYNLSYGDN